MPAPQNTALLKLRTTLQLGEALSNVRRQLARYAAALTEGVPAAGVTAQELIALIGQAEADRILAAQALFTDEAEQTPPPQTGA